MASKKKQIVAMLLDQTGSMERHKGATISAFNEYVGKVAKENPAALFSLTLFDTATTEHRYTLAKIKDVVPLTSETYKPNAMTNLYDAIAALIRRTDEQLATLKGEKDVIVVLQTDGQENSSKEFSQGMIFSMIKGREAAGWVFVFLGADIDAYEASEAIGVHADNALQYAGGQSVKAFARAAEASSAYFRTGQRRGLMSKPEDE